jgi:NAD(P)-dependent dehydrogenase (short-subunit alcohol dehydrogenase family)
MGRRFDGLAILVTGATGGFGRRVCERLAEDGARLVLSDQEAVAVEELAAGLGTETVMLAGDVSHEELSEKLVRLAVASYGRLDIAINNAGVAQSYVKLPQVPSEEARRIIDIDLMGVFYAMKHQLPQMERQHRHTGKGGSIVNISSVAGIAGAPRLSVYAAAKHGVIGLTRTAALEYATKGVRVNAVCPSYARTPMIGNALKVSGELEAGAHAEVARGIPMKRLAEVEEVVEAILFAADPKNAFMTGHALPVDGGLSAI